MRRLLASLCCLAAFVAAAAEIGVMPVGLSLSAQNDRQALNVTNRGGEAVVVQVEAVAWTQSDGEDHYVPTRDLLVNPLVFSLQPGTTQVVRVGLRHAGDGGREAAYRLFVREVPQPPSLLDEVGGKQQIRVLMELRLPVYVAPAKSAPAQEWRARRRTDGGISVEVTNVGNVHLVVAGLKLRSAGEPVDSVPSAMVATSATVLAGQRRRWDLRPASGRQIGNELVLEVVGDRGSQHVALDFGGN